MGVKLTHERTDRGVAPPEPPGPGFRQWGSPLFQEIWVLLTPKMACCMKTYSTKTMECLGISNSCDFTCCQTRRPCPATPPSQRRSCTPPGVPPSPTPISSRRQLRVSSCSSFIDLSLARSLFTMASLSLARTSSHPGASSGKWLWVLPAQKQGTILVTARRVRQVVGWVPGPGVQGLDMHLTFKVALLGPFNHLGGEGKGGWVVGM